MQVCRKVVELFFYEMRRVKATMFMSERRFLFIDYDDILTIFFMYVIN